MVNSTTVKTIPKLRTDGIYELTHGLRIRNGNTLNEDDFSNWHRWLVFTNKDNDLIAFYAFDVSPC